MAFIGAQAERDLEAEREVYDRGGRWGVGPAEEGVGGEREDCVHGIKISSPPHLSLSPLTSPGCGRARALSLWLFASLSPFLPWPPPSVSLSPPQNKPHTQ
jgi:hypothetical protein